MFSIANVNACISWGPTVSFGDASPVASSRATSSGFVEAMAKKSLGLSVGIEGVEGI
jgi:hypothetical protein